MAWLTATPKVKEADGRETKLPPRIGNYEGGGEEPPLPPLTARHVYDMLMEVGPIEPTGMGPLPLSWREIDAWASRTFRRLTAWEARQLRRLSAAYLAESVAAEDHTCPAPWWPQGTQVDRGAEERRLRAVLG